MKYLLFVALLLLSASGYCQDVHPSMTPGRTVEIQKPKSYADSAEFAKLFKEFYPTIKPEKTLKEQSEEYFQNISRSFKMQGIDSAKAAKVAFKNLDEKAYEKIYFDTYRKNLSAKELKKYMEFVKTPEGKHIAEVMVSLQRVSADANMYIARTMNINLTPVRQEAHEKWEKEHPGQKMGVPMSPGQQQLQNKLPKRIDSLSTPQPRQ